MPIKQYLTPSLTVSLRITVLADAAAQSGIAAMQGEIERRGYRHANTGIVQCVPDFKRQASGINVLERRERRRWRTNASHQFASGLAVRGNDRDANASIKWLRIESGLDLL